VSWGSMAFELIGVAPQLPFDYAKTLVQRARADTYRKSLWSFQLFEANWTSPSLINVGTVATVQGQNTVQFDATAQAALNAVGLTTIPVPVAQRQFRIATGTIYNFYAYNQATGIATLDRSYAEAGGSGAAYQVYQLYYPAPMKDFKAWIDVVDMVNYNPMILNKTREYADQRDPQRTMYFIPTHVLPYQLDQNPASPTYQNLMFELWSGPLYPWTYQLYGLRDGAAFVNNSDTLPPQIGEDCVMALAKSYAYQWCEANWQSGGAWGKTKPNYLALMQTLVNNNPKRGGPGEYNRLFVEYRQRDRAAVSNFNTRMRRSWTWPNSQGFYDALSGYASPGAPW
jgi:hypothetical protein